MKEVLSRVVIEGLPGNHQFYVQLRNLKTKVPKFLKERHSEEVMIILQNELWNLEVSDSSFPIELRFNAINEMLFIPFSVLTAFVDLSVKFALQFTPTLSERDLCPDENDDFLETRRKRVQLSQRTTSFGFDSFKKK